MAYSEDLRKKVIGYLEEGNTPESAKAVFKIGLTTIKRWQKQYKDTGSLAKKELHRSFRKPTLQNCQSMKKSIRMRICGKLPKSLVVRTTQSDLP